MLYGILGFCGTPVGKHCLRVKDRISHPYKTMCKMLTTVGNGKLMLKLCVHLELSYRANVQPLSVVCVIHLFEQSLVPVWYEVQRYRNVYGTYLTKSKFLV
jgi:hypothetical protein